jgi:hypothetical protein
MSKNPVDLCDPSRVAAAAAFIFVGGMLVASSAIMVASGAILALSFVIGAFIAIRRKLQVRLAPVPSPAYKRR